MAEENIDISGNVSKNLSEYIDRKIDVVITVCDNANTVSMSFEGYDSNYIGDDSTFHIYGYFYRPVRTFPVNRRNTTGVLVIQRMLKALKRKYCKHLGKFEMK